MAGTAGSSGMERKLLPSTPHALNDGVLQHYSSDKISAHTSFNKRGDDVYFRERVAQLKKDVTALQHGEHISCSNITATNGQATEPESNSSRMKQQNCECGASSKVKNTPSKPPLPATNRICRHHQVHGENLRDDADDEILLAPDGQRAKNDEQLAFERGGRNDSVRRRIHSHSMSDSDIIAPRKAKGVPDDAAFADGEDLSSYQRAAAAREGANDVVDAKARDNMLAQEDLRRYPHEDDVFNESSSGMNILDDADDDVLDGACYSKGISASNNNRGSTTKQRKMRFKTVRSALQAPVELRSFNGSSSAPPCGDTQSDPGILGGGNDQDDDELSNTASRLYQRSDSRSGAMQGQHDNYADHDEYSYVVRNEFATAGEQNSEERHLHAASGLPVNSTAATESLQQQMPPPLPSTSSFANNNAQPPQNSMLCSKCSQHQLNSGEWDRQSVFSCTTGGQSGVSVQLLQDRILEMQENHYTTNEELQAIYQELTDLQVSYEELVLEKDSLAEDKNILLESLHTQTEKLEACREQVENFTNLLCSGEAVNADDTSTVGDVRETCSLPPNTGRLSAEDAVQQLDSKSADNVAAAVVKQPPLTSSAAAVERLLTTKAVEDESARERRLIAIVQFMQNEKHQYEEQKRHAQERYDSVKDMLDEVQRALEDVQQQCKNKDRTLLSYKNQVRKESNRNQQQAEEIRRLMACLQREKDKSKQFIAHKDTTKLLGSLEAIVNKSEHERVNAERELNGKCAELEQKSHEIAKLEDWAASLAKEKVMKEDVYRQEIGVIQQRLRTIEAERDQKLEALKRAQDEIAAAKSAERDAQRRLVELEQRYRDECDEWEAFQQDLLVTVRVANELKSEAQEELEQTTESFQALQKRCAQLEQDLMKLQQQQNQQDAVNVAVAGCSAVMPSSSNAAKMSRSSVPLHADDAETVRPPQNPPPPLQTINNNTSTPARDSSAAPTMYSNNSNSSSSNRQRRSVRALIDTMESAIKSAKTKPPSTSATLQLTPSTANGGKDENDAGKTSFVFHDTINFMPSSSTLYSTSSLGSSQDSSSSSSSNAATVTPPTSRKNGAAVEESQQQQLKNDNSEQKTAITGSAVDVAEIGRRLRLAAAAADAGLESTPSNYINTRADRMPSSSGDKLQRNVSVTVYNSALASKTPRSQSLSSAPVNNETAENAKFSAVNGNSSNRASNILAKTTATAAALDAATAADSKPHTTVRGTNLGNGPPPPLPPRRFIVSINGETSTDKNNDAGKATAAPQQSILSNGVHRKSADEAAVNNISTGGSTSVRQIRHQFAGQNDSSSATLPLVAAPSTTSSLSRSSAVTSSMATTPLSSIVSPTHHAAAAAARARRLSNITNPLRDPLTKLTHGHGSKRNALLKWCQEKTMDYKGVDITNFSTSWSDGLALCALLASLGLSTAIAYSTLNNTDKRRNFDVAFKAAASAGVPTPPKDELDLNDLMTSDWPDWRPVFKYVTAIYAKLDGGRGGNTGGTSGGGR